MYLRKTLRAVFSSVNSSCMASILCPRQVNAKTILLWGWAVPRLTRGDVDSTSNNAKNFKQRVYSSSYASKVMHELLAEGP
jgi:hypothetical protein